MQTVSVLTGLSVFPVLACVVIGVSAAGPENQAPPSAASITASVSADLCGVKVPHGGIVDKNGTCAPRNARLRVSVFVLFVCVCGVPSSVVPRAGRIMWYNGGARYVKSVLRSKSSEAHKVEALQTAGIRTANTVDLSSEGCSV